MASSRRPPPRPTPSSSPATRRAVDPHHTRHDTPVSDENAMAPTEAQMLLCCLDYLRDVRRSYPNPKVLQQQHGLRADYLSVAIYALSRALPDYRSNSTAATTTTTTPNDSRFDYDAVNQLTAPDEIFPRDDPKSTDNWISIPNLTKINEEILYPTEPPHADTTMTLPYPDAWYLYDDMHPSNKDRLYALNGLASDGTPPLTLPELLLAGMTTLQVRSREAAEQDMIRSPLFEQFVSAVEKKGFFRDMVDPDDTSSTALEQQAYHERYSKVVQKFRTKLAVKAWNEQMPSEAHVLAQDTLDGFLTQRGRNIDEFLPDAMMRNHESDDMPSSAFAVGPAASRADDDFTVGMSVVTSATRKVNTFPTSPASHPDDEEEAERLKQKGNAHMQHKEYALAVESYTAALKLSPSGRQSHVYFSNRAAAHLSLRHFHDAIVDSERSLALQPTYAKAHARLGLAHFLLGDYRQAVEAYTVSLKYDPDNKSSRTYLAKAAKRVAAQEADGGGKGTSGFSLASEMDSTSLVGEAVGDAEGRKQIVNEREAEKHKLMGNSHMTSRNYQAAMESYSWAIRLCPRGASSHVYYSNRAAALCYLEHYEEAEADSLRSLALEPTYGKAHARLGLSRFFMGDYEGAVQAYTAALSYDPDNAASKSYLAKAKSRLQQSSTSDRASSPGGVHLQDARDPMTRSVKEPGGRGRSKNGPARV